MNIVINDKKTIAELQNEFSTAFPYLKLEVMVKPPKLGGAHPAKVVKHANTTLAECRVQHTKGTLTVTPQTTVADLTQDFSDVFGLAVRVKRKSGKYWLHTTITDFWSLEEQNKQGEALSGQEGNEAAE
jgi:hypothetical protein